MTLTEKITKLKDQASRLDEMSDVMLAVMVVNALGIIEELLKLNPPTAGRKKS